MHCRYQCQEHSLQAAGVSKGTNRNAYEVPYGYQESGSRIFVYVEINGKMGRCSFDTGNTSAEISFNDAAQARKYGITIPHDAKSIVTTGQTIRGRIRIHN